MPESKENQNKTQEHKQERIAKVLARAGLCSRREAERWITEGRVSVNGNPLATPAVTVNKEDKIIVDGKPLPQAEKTRLFLYHKPAGLVTTAKDERGRQTVFSALPDQLPRLISVGRLDLNTEGLLLLTNDGELARYLELPATGWKRRYRVRVHGAAREDKINKLQKGVVIDGIKYAPADISIDKTQGANTWLTVTLTEGKNREIRKLMDHIDLKVTRLIRTSYGSFQLGNMKQGDVKEVPYKVIKEQIAGFFK